MAYSTGRSSVANEITKATSVKRRQEDNKDSREFTILNVTSQVDLREQVDSDKMYFLNEFLKLQAYAENYYKIKQYVGFYNAGIVIAYICIQTHHYSLACKVYSLFG